MPQAYLHLCTLLVMFNIGLMCKMPVEEGAFEDCTGLPVSICAVFSL